MEALASGCINYLFIVAAVHTGFIFFSTSSGFGRDKGGTHEDVLDTVVWLLNTGLNGINSTRLFNSGFCLHVDAATSPRTPTHAHHIGYLNPICTKSIS